MTRESSTTAITADEFDDLIDNATHAVNNLIPDHVLASLSQDERSNLLVQINDALTDVIGPFIEREF